MRCFGSPLITHYVNGACITVDGSMTAASPLNPGLFDEICTHSLPWWRCNRGQLGGYFWPLVDLSRFMTLTLI